MSILVGCTSGFNDKNLFNCTFITDNNYRIHFIQHSPSLHPTPSSLSDICFLSDICMNLSKINFDLEIIKNFKIF